MKEISAITVTDRIRIGQDFAGYCADAGRYLYALHRSYCISYHDFYFIDEQQYLFLKSHADEIVKGTVPRPDFLRALREICPASSDYCRDYRISHHEARKAEPIPFFDGPFLYDGQYFYYHLNLRGRHFAVPPIILKHSGGQGDPFAGAPGFSAYVFDDEDYHIRFFGKDVTEELDA